MSPGGVSVSSGSFEDAIEAPMAPLDLADLSAPAAVAPVQEPEEVEEEMQIASPVRATVAAEIPCTPAGARMVEAEEVEVDASEPVDVTAGGASADIEEQEEGEIFSDVESVAEDEPEVVQIPAVEEDAEIVAVTAATSSTTETEETEEDRIALDYTSPVQRGSSVAGSVSAEAPVAGTSVCPVSPDGSVVSTSSAVTTASTASAVAATTAAKAPEVLVKKPLNLMGAKPVKSTVVSVFVLF